LTYSADCLSRRRQVVQVDIFLQLYFSSKNPGIPSIKKDHLQNRNPSLGPSKFRIFCPFQRNKVVALYCHPNGSITLEGKLGTCDQGCDTENLGNFSQMTSNCRKGLKKNGLEYDGNSCRRVCALNPKIETARKVQCRCASNGRNCEYVTKIRGKYRVGVYSLIVLALCNLLFEKILLKKSRFHFL
jgi:hypothetical protein